MRTLVLTLPLLAGPALAQGPGRPVELPALPTPGGALLRLHFPNGRTPVGGFKITREGGGRTVTLAAPVPVPKETALAKGWVDAKGYDTLRAVYVEGNTPLNKDAFARFQLDLRVVADPKLARTLGLLFEDGGLQNGVKYTYRVTAAVNGREVEVGRAAVTPGPTPPLRAPSNLDVRPDTGRAVLAWRETDPLTVAYRIYRAEEGGAAVLLQPSPYFPRGDEAGRAAGPSFTDTKLRRDGRYRYQVSAQDLFGRESERTPAVAVNLADGEPPPVAVIAAMEAGDKTITLRWEKTADPRVKAVKVLRGETPEAMREIASLPPGATAYEDKGGRGGTWYTYALALETASGDRSVGPGRRVRFLNATPPAAPTNVRAVFDPEKRTVRVTWTPSPGDEVAGYYVTRAPEARTDPRAAQQLNGSPVKGPFEHAIGVTPGEDWVYRVVAISTSDRRSAPSAPVTLVLPEEDPSIVLRSAQATPEAITLEWDLRGARAGGIEVFRLNPNKSLALVAKLPGTAKSFVDRNVVPSRPYAYVAFPLDAKGTRIAPSNVVSATVPLRIELGGVPDLKATLGPDGVRLSWGRARNAYGYMVYRVQDGAATLLAGTRDTRLTDPDGKAGVVYRVVPRAVNDTLGEEAEVRVP